MKSLTTRAEEATRMMMAAMAICIIGKMPMEETLKLLTPLMQEKLQIFQDELLESQRQSGEVLAAALNKRG